MNDDLPRSYRLVTSTGSAYLLDLGESTLTRLPREYSPAHDHDGVWSYLRRDGEAIGVISVDKLEVGAPAMFTLDLRRDGVPTVRITSPVVSLDLLSGNRATDVP